MKKDQVKYKKRRYWVLLDSGGDIRNIFPYLEWALKERDRFGWGNVIEVDIKLKGSPKVWANIG